MLRCGVGDPVVLFDGRGGEAGATITAVERDGVSVEVSRVVHRTFDRRIRLTLAVAMPRRNRQSFLFEKCTELGTWSIWPMVCARSVVKPKPEGIDKWRRTAIEAAKQSERCWLPKIEPPQSFSDTLEKVSEFDTSIVTDTDTSFEPLSDCLLARGDMANLLVWIGPEGGLAPEEIEAARCAGAVGARLGPGVLRVETAAITVAALAAVLGTHPTEQDSGGT